MDFQKEVLIVCFDEFLGSCDAENMTTQEGGFPLNCRCIAVRMRDDAGFGFVIFQESNAVDRFLGLELGMLSFEMAVSFVNCSSSCRLLLAFRFRCVQVHSCERRPQVRSKASH